MIMGIFLVGTILEETVMDTRVIIRVTCTANKGETPLGEGEDSFTECEIRAVQRFIQTVRLNDMPSNDCAVGLHRLLVVLTSMVDESAETKTAILDQESRY